MRIILHIDSLGSGGAQRQLVTLARGLRERGHSVEINVYQAQAHFEHELSSVGIRVVRVVKQSRYTLRPAWTLIRHCLDFDADIVIAFLRTPAIHAVLSGFVLRKVKVIVSERSGIPSEPLPATYWIAQQLNRGADAITTNSLSGASLMSAYFPWMKSKLYHIVNGYKLTDLAPKNVSTVNRLTLLTLASVHPRKNPLVLANAVKVCLEDMRIPVHILWAGEPAFVDGECKPKQETDEYLKEHQLEGAWTWLGLVTETSKLFEECDALIHTSKAEGFANVIAEALISATPVLIGDVADQRKVVEESRGGLLFDATNPLSIAKVIQDFYGKRDNERLEMGLRGRLYAESNLSEDKMVESYESLSLSVLKGGS